MPVCPGAVNAGSAGKHVRGGRDGFVTLYVTNLSRDPAATCRARLFPVGI